MLHREKKILGEENKGRKLTGGTGGALEPLKTIAKKQGHHFIYPSTR
jgi:hypothetical protein